MAQPAIGRPPAASKHGGLTWRGFVLLAVSTLLMPAALFVAAGHLDWPMGWAYSGIVLIAVVGGRAIVAVRNPDLLLERGRFAESADGKAWDRRIVPFVGVIGPLAICLVAGLDERLDWSADLSPAVQLAGLAACVLGAFLATWAMVVNRFFSAVVRIQRDRGHSVVSTGPYAFVRHPSYTGAIILYAATGPALDSLWALAPAALLAAVIVVRTALEDRTLREELPGYAEYTRRVRFRIYPGVW